jgi:hypothetical protein
MVVPPGHGVQMIHALQGSPQAGRLWEDRAEEYIVKKLKFRQSPKDPCYYSKWEGDDFVQIIRQTDDFRVGGDTDELTDKYYALLRGEWKMSVQVDKTWNGLHIVHDRVGGVLTISMVREIETLLEEYGMTNCQPVATPAAPNTKLEAPLESATVKPEDLAFPYRALVGALLWIARTGRPDILYAVNQLTKFARAWNATHITAARRVLRYLKGTIHLKLTMRRGNELKAVVFADADFAGEPEGNPLPMRSTSGTVVYMHGVGVLETSCNLEPTIATATAEAEYTALARAAKSVGSLREFFDDIGFTQSEPTVIFNDNQAAVTMVKQKFSSSNTRHIKIKFHLVRQMVADKEIEVRFKPTEEMIADIMTKALDRVKFEAFRAMLLDGIDATGSVI